MGIKATIKKKLPDSFVQTIKHMKRGHELKHYYKEQYRRFFSQAALPSNEGERQLEALLQYHAHEIEKGLSHNDFRPGFGRRGNF